MTALDSIAPAFPTFSAAACRFLEAPRFAVVATLNPDGSPLQAVIWYRLEDDTIIFNSRLGRQWPTNIQRDRHVSITVVDGYDYIEMRGEVEIDEDPQLGQAIIAGLARRYESNGEAAEAQIAAFARERRVTFKLRPSRIFERLSSN
jgi:PPOX class probable F420-dependent enzyme